MEPENKKLEKTSIRYAIRNLACATLLTIALFVGGNAQNTEQKTAATDTTPKSPLTQVAKPEPAAMPVLKYYKEVTIGTAAVEVRDKLGKAKIDDKDGFYYRFGDEELAQIRLDENEKVKLIAITYTSNHKSPPSFVDVLGIDPMATDTKADGSVYKLVTYPTAGYWVSYSRAAGTRPSVTVTMQKLR